MRLLLLAALTVGVATAAPSADPAPTLRSAAASADTIAEGRKRLADQVLASIAGRERLPAESVFSNITVLKGVPAGQLLRRMDLGYGASLGVGCGACHVIGEWGREDSARKQIARDMMAMTERINRELLPAVPGLRSRTAVVNCTTCHRGAVKPALSLTPPPGG